MYLVSSKDTNKTHQAKTKGEALLWATCTANEIKRATSQKIRFLIKEI